MKSKTIRSGLMAAVLAILIASCSPPKTIYLSNKTGLPVLLTVEPDTAFSTHAQQRAFRDSLHGKHIVSGHRVLNFGAGDWTDSDIEDLKAVLSKTYLHAEGGTKAHPVPPTIRVHHYQLFVEELLVRFRLPERDD